MTISENGCSGQALHPIFKELHIKVNNVINLEVNEEEIIDRLSKRLVCKSCGKIYNSEIDHFNTADKCFKCGGELRERGDDTPETIRKRLEIYRSETEPVKKYYEKLGLLRNVNGIGEIVDIIQRLLSTLKK